MKTKPMPKPEIIPRPKNNPLNKLFTSKEWKTQAAELHEWYDAGYAKGLADGQNRFMNRLKTRERYLRRIDFVLCADSYAYVIEAEEAGFRAKKKS